jgi:hypothetical protein
MDDLTNMVPRHDILGSGWFLASTAVCCAIGVGFTSWIASDSSAVVRVVAALIGLAAALGVMLLVAWVLASDQEPAASVPDREPAMVEPQDVLGPKLEQGLELRTTVEAGASDDRVGAWIEEVHLALERDRPGVLGYYDALAARAFADDRERLEAHLDRLATIVDLDRQ